MSFTTHFLLYTDSGSIVVVVEHPDQISRSLQHQSSLNTFNLCILSHTWIVQCLIQGQLLSYDRFKINKCWHNLFHTSIIGIIIMTCVFIVVLQWSKCMYRLNIAYMHNVRSFLKMGEQSLFESGGKSPLCTCTRTHGEGNRVCGYHMMVGDSEGGSHSFS